MNEAAPNFPPKKDVIEYYHYHKPAVDNERILDEILALREKVDRLTKMFKHIYPQEDKSREV